MKLLNLFVLCFFSYFFLSLNADNSVANAMVADVYFIHSSKVIVKYVVAGSIIVGQTSMFLIMRYNADGTLDTTFNPEGTVSGTPGVVITNINNNNCAILAVTIDTTNPNNHRYIAAGYVNNQVNNAIALARYNQDGTLDSTFNPNGLVSGTPGIVVTNLTNFGSTAYSVFVSVGAYIVAGSINNGAFISVLVARYLMDGSLDPSFNPPGLNASPFPGVVITSISNDDDEARGTFGDRLGRIVIGGFSKSPTSSDFLAIRYNHNGSLDTSFANKGIFTLNYNTQSAFNAVTVDALGRPGLAGYTSNASNTMFTVIRLTTDGVLDPTFNPRGVASNLPGMSVIVPIGTNNSQANAINIDSFDNLVVAGFAFENQNKVFTLVRYTEKGLLDTTFNGTGIVTTAIVPANNFELSQSSIGQANAIVADAPNSNNTITVAGFSQNGVQTNVTLARYKFNGSLDTSFNSTYIQPGVLITTLLGDTQSSLPIGYTELILPEQQPLGLSSILLESLNANQNFALPTITGQPPLVFGVSAPSLTGTASPGATITILSHNLPVTTAIANAQGIWDVVLPAMADGIYSISVIAENPLTHFTLASKVMPIVIDTKIPPPATIIYPKQNEIIGERNPTILGNAKPHSYITVYLNGRRQDTVIANDAGAWSIPLRPISEGTQVIYAISTDRVSAKSSRSKPTTFTIDTHAWRPPKITSPVDQHIFTNDTPTFSGEARNNARVQILLNNKKIGETKADAKGAWTYRFQKPLTDGRYQLIAAIDNLTNKALIHSLPLTFTVDTKPTQIKPRASLFEREYLISGTSEPNSRLKLYIDGDFLAEVRSNSDGRWGYTPFTRKIKGRHILTVSTLDRGGNVISMIQRDITL